jgi:hypothetical protein
MAFPWIKGMDAMKELVGRLGAALVCMALSAGAAGAVTMGNFEIKIVNTTIIVPDKIKASRIAFDYSVMRNGYDYKYFDDSTFVDYLK